MLIYLLILLITLFFLYFSNNRNKNTYTFFVILIMMLVSGLRDVSIGIDTQTYVRIFEGKQFKNAEIAFIFVIDFFKLFSKNEYYWLLFVSLIIYLPLFLLIKKESPLPVFSALIFMISVSHFFPETMNIIRHCMAVPFVLLALSSWSDDKIKHTIIFIIIAFLFHNSSIIVIPFLFLKNIKFSRKSIIITLIIVCSIGISNNTFFFNRLIDGLNNVKIPFFNDDIATNISGYSNYSDISELGLKNWKGYIMRFFPLITLCLILIPKKYDNKKYNFYFNVLFVTTCLFSLLNTVHYGFRIVFSLMAIQILLIPMSYFFGSLNRKLYISIYTVLLVLLYIVYLFGLMSSKIDGMIVPYDSWLY